MSSTEWKVIAWMVGGLVFLIFWGMATDKSKPRQTRQDLAEGFVDKLDRGGNRDE